MRFSYLTGLLSPEAHLARDAFLQLLKQTSFLTHDRRAAAAQAAVLRRLVEQAAAVLLFAAEDVKDDGSRLANLLNDVQMRD